LAGELVADLKALVATGTDDLNGHEASIFKRAALMIEF
jgi:hypothetical protein